MTLIAAEAPWKAPCSAFLDLPAVVYAGDPASIPEEPAAVSWAFSATNPWFRSGEAMTFCEPGRGRVAAFRPSGLTVGGEPAAFFGFFETVGDDSAERVLFREAEAWARERGAHVLYGPVDFATAVGYRVLLSAEPGATQFPGEPWTPPEYGPRLERLGFALERRYLTQVVSLEEMRRAREAHRPVLEKLHADGFRFEPITPDLWLSRLRDMHGLCDAIFGSNFAYTPMSFETFAAHAGERLAARLCPRTSTLCTAPEGTIAGVFLTFPDWGPLARRGAGTERIPLQAIATARHFDRLCAHGRPTLVLKTVGVAPAFRRLGLFAGLLVSLLDRAEGLYGRFLGALIREDNPSRRFFDDFAPTKRWYGLYAKRLGPPSADASGSSAPGGTP